MRDACLWLPESEEVSSHGSPNFRVRGKTFATFVVNHHGDGRVALWLAAPPGAQEQHVGADPGHFFVPPYVGHRGWFGVDLNGTVAWARVAALVREAYVHVAPAALSASLGKAPRLRAPARKLAPGDIDPLRSARGLALLETLRTICGRLPETRESRQFGHPVWQAGTRTFAWARCAEGRSTLTFWVGVEQQSLLTADPRFRIPAYLGHRGWIDLDVTDHCDVREITAMALQSYRHFALRRMLRRLDEPPDDP